MPVLSLAKRPYVRLATLCPKSPSMRQQRARLPLHRTEQGDCQKTPGHIRPCIPQGLSGALSSLIGKEIPTIWWKMDFSQSRLVNELQKQNTSRCASPGYPGPSLRPSPCPLCPVSATSRTEAVPSEAHSPGRRPVSCKAGSRNFSGRKRSDIPGNLSQVTKW